MAHQNPQNQMTDRLAAGLDPLTGEKMETAGAIREAYDGTGNIVDETGRAVTLSGRGTWIYAEFRNIETEAFALEPAQA